MIELNAPARLHLGLLDLGNVSYRVFGGFGLMVDDPGIRVNATPSQDIRFTGDVSPEDIRRIYGPVQNLLEEKKIPGVSIHVEQSTPPHIGLGHGTALTLSALVGTCLAHGLEVDARTIQALSKRGGTSGIGINGFFSGGLIVDGGQPLGTPQLPSSAQTPSMVPPALVKFPLAKHLRVSIFSTRGPTYSGAKERRFFADLAPIPRGDVLEQFALLYHGVLPALMDNDLVTAGRAYSEFSQLGFKSREIEAAGTKALIESLKELYPMVGMSSFGPCLFAITDERVLQPEIDGLDHLVETAVSTGGYRAQRG